MCAFSHRISQSTIASFTSCKRSDCDDSRTSQGTCDRITIEGRYRQKKRVLVESDGGREAEPE
jgi:hypothetical protein